MDRRKELELISDVIAQKPARVFPVKKPRADDTGSPKSDDERPPRDGVMESGPVDLSRGTLSDERIAEFRQRIDNGSYDAPAMIQALAERLLESGDL